MRKNKKWLSGLLAIAASLLLLTGCEEGYYGENSYEYSDVAVGAERREAETDRPGEEQEEDASEGDKTSSGEAEGVSGESGDAAEDTDSYEDGRKPAGEDQNETWSGEIPDAAENTDSYEDDRKPSGENQNDPAGPGAELDEYGVYTSREDVALYLYTYDELPENFITKKEARALGWESGSLEPYAPGMCIGGDYFGNYEGNLPEAEGRKYYECDIDTLGARSRGAKRIVYSNDGLIYYTEDHYETFTLLYGEE